ncbi:hypothetical protein D3C87_651100 [compost metagenome]
MSHRIGTWLGLGLLLAGCGSPLPAAVGDAPFAKANVRQDMRFEQEIVPATHAAPASGKDATASVVIAFLNPRTSFTSEKIDLKTGKTLPADDGMGPEGDLSFFYDGSRFQIIANAGGGAVRTLAPAKAGKPIGAFAMAPIPLQEGSEILLKQDHGVYSVTITGLQAGSMTFLPGGTGTGTGSVTFSYRPQTIASI